MSEDQLKAEVARLKTEVQHLMIFCNSTLIPSKELQAENARLKAEVERLRDELGLMHQMFENHLTPQIRKAIVLAAKEGKPSA